MDAKTYLKQCRDVLGLKSNYALHKLWGVPQTTLSAWENGKRTPNPQMRRIFAQTIGKDELEVIFDPDLEKPRNRRKEQGGSALLSCLMAIILAIGLLFPMAAVLTKNTDLVPTLGVPHADTLYTLSNFWRKCKRLWNQCITVFQDLALNYA